MLEGYRDAKAYIEDGDGVQEQNIKPNEDSVSRAYKRG